jgi:hypothetical protein
LSSDLESGQTRFVLTMGRSDRDLYSHLKNPDNNKIYYNQKVQSRALLDSEWVLLALPQNGKLRQG